MSALTKLDILRTLSLGLLAIFAASASGGLVSSGTANADEAGYRPWIAAPRQRAPRAPVIPDGLIAGFEDGEVASTVGAGWSISTDASAGGASVAEMTVVDGGAVGSSMSLRVAGTIVGRPGMPAWAGAVFSPGRREFGRANLSAYSGISFWVRGNGAPISVALFAQSLGQDPAQLLRPTTDVWTEHRMPFSDFQGVDAAGLKAISFSGADPGDFEFQIDELRVW